MTWGEELLIKDYVTIQGDRFEYLNMIPVIKLPVNSLEMISLYQPYSHTCWIPSKHYHSLYKELHVDVCGRLENFMFVFDWPN